jgi:hypothetical protein
MQREHSFPSSRSGTALTRPIPILTPVGSFPLPAIARRRLTRVAMSALAFHYAQLEATAFREEFDAASFQDHTLPKSNTIHKKAGPLIKEWVKLLQTDESANAVIVGTGSKRKAVSPG